MPDYEDYEDFSTLADLDFEEDTAIEQSSQNQQEQEKEGAEGNFIKLKKEDWERLEKRLKDQQEFIRQQSETIKELKEFKDRLLGVDKEKEKIQKEKELREKFEEDPLTTVDEIVSKKYEEKLKELETKLHIQEEKNKIKEVLLEFEKEYDINWDRDYKKILPYIDYFSPKARREKPREVLKALCKLAGIELKKRETQTLPSGFYIEGGVSGGVLNKEIKSEAEKIKKEILEAGKRKPIFNF